MREILTGLPVIRAFSTEKHEEKRFDKANMDLMKTNLFVNRAMTFMMPIMMLIMNGISVLIMCHSVIREQTKMYSMIFILRQGRERRQRLSEVPEAENPHWSI